MDMYNSKTLNLQRNVCWGLLVLAMGLNAKNISKKAIELMKEETCT